MDGWKTIYKDSPSLNADTLQGTKDFDAKFINVMSK
jgi:hypothetical protein